MGNTVSLTRVVHVADYSLDVCALWCKSVLPIIALMCVLCSVSLVADYSLDVCAL